MGADAVDGFQVLCVHEQTGELILVALQAKQNAQTYVINTAVHGTIHGLGVVGVVVLGAGGMQFQVALLVVGLLEQDMNAIPALLQLAVILHRGGGDVHVDAADVAILL